MTTFRGQKAFTLIELLVVIAIIAIIAGILFPVFAQAKAAAKTAACLSNMKQVAIAWPMYANDSDDVMALPHQPYTGTVPMGAYLPTQYPLYVNWYTDFPARKGGSDATAGSLQPYMKSAQITDCPGAQGLPNTNGMEPVAYGLNGSIAFGTDAFVGEDSTAFQAMSYSRISHSSETILYGDTATGMYGAGVQRGGVLLNFATTCLTAPTTHGRHAGRANLSWLDGHAKAMPVDTSIQKALLAYGGGDAAETSSMEACIKAGIGDVLKAPIPPGNPTAWRGTAAAGPSAYYYLLNKPS